MTPDIRQSRQAFTLIETLIAMFISSILFLTIFNLTQISLELSRENMAFSVSLGRELSAIETYDKTRLALEPALLPRFFSKQKVHTWGIHAKSPLGYQAVLLP